MELSIIITSYKNPELLKLCIDSIQKNIRLSDYEIIVADSETGEKIALMMQEDYPEIVFLPSAENLHFGGEVNAGIKKSWGEYILILNDDIIVKPDSIESLLSYSQSHPEAGIVGPQLLNFNETFQPTCFRFLSPFTILYRRTTLGKLPFAREHLDRFLMKDFDHQEVREVDWLMGSAMMLKSSAVKKVGLVDRRFQMYMEDTDWCRRFWENGYKVIYYPQAKMYHYHRRGSAGKGILNLILFNQLTRLHIQSAIKYFLKYAGKDLPAHQ
ncbi:MAG: glycosyltransferase family 2 protein [Parcubacteria group bacterium]